MKSCWSSLWGSLVPKLAFISGLILLLGLMAQAIFTVRYQAAQSTQNIAAGAELLGNTIRLGTHYAMMLNARDDLTQIIQKMGQQQEIVRLRIISKGGEIMFSKLHAEVGTRLPAAAPECLACHRASPPLTAMRLADRTRVMEDKNGQQLVGIISPIYNEPGCTAAACHVHASNTTVLGILDVVVSTREPERAFVFFRRSIGLFTLITFMFTAVVLFFAIDRLVKAPVQALIEGTRRISAGDYGNRIMINSSQEMCLLADAINHMGQEIGSQQAELNRERDKYQGLFEVVPCLITVQDRNFRLTSYNRKFADLFAPQPGDYCYSAYKGRTVKCDNCPVERTFGDGRSHFSEESGINKDGSPSHWIVTTSPLRNAAGEIVAAMEMSLDVSKLKHLDKQ